MEEQRNFPRYDTEGKARIPKVLEKGVFLKNLSITGCCVKYTGNTEDIKIGEEYKIKVKPEKNSHAGKFEIQGECRWIRKMEDICEFGFYISVSPTGRDFKHYVDYIAWHSNNRKS